jgi:hypothetical protein
MAFECMPNHEILVFATSRASDVLFAGWMRNDDVRRKSSEAERQDIIVAYPNLPVTRYTAASPSIAMGTIGHADFDPLSPAPTLARPETRSAIFAVKKLVVVEICS